LQSESEAAFKRSGATPAQQRAEVAIGDADLYLYPDEYSKDKYEEIFEVNSEKLALQQENLHLQNELTAATATFENARRWRLILLGNNNPIGQERIGGVGAKPAREMHHSLANCIDMRDEEAQENLALKRELASIQRMIKDICVKAGCRDAEEMQRAYEQEIYYA
jgi:hypothetical protein